MRHAAQSLPRKQRGLHHAGGAHVPQGALRDRDLPLSAAAGAGPQPLPGAGAARVPSEALGAAGGHPQVHQGRRALVPAGGHGPRPALLQGPARALPERRAACTQGVQHGSQGHRLGRAVHLPDGGDLPQPRPRGGLGRGQRGEGPLGQRQRGPRRQEAPQRGPRHRLPDDALSGARELRPHGHRGQGEHRGVDQLASRDRQHGQGQRACAPRAGHRFHDAQADPKGAQPAQAGPEDTVQARRGGGV
mmetsp:Transcript_7032/g.16878  ORF Transcript_7032/g.16878 Transcript_7032/m.16878 type:complete len:247 (+) Transcript_7032:1563-2303(+)